jgi:hypothetical protein
VLCRDTIAVVDLVVCTQYCAIYIGSVRILDWPTIKVEGSTNSPFNAPWEGNNLECGLGQSIDFEIAIATVSLAMSH